MAKFKEENMQGIYYGMLEYCFCLQGSVPVYETHRHMDCSGK